MARIEPSLVCTASQCAREVDRADATKRGHAPPSGGCVPVGGGLSLIHPERALVPPFPPRTVKIKRLKGRHEGRRDTQGMSAQGRVGVVVDSDRPGMFWGESLRHSCPYRQNTHPGSRSSRRSSSTSISTSEALRPAGTRLTISHARLQSGTRRYTGPSLPRIRSLRSRSGSSAGGSGGGAAALIKGGSSSIHRPFLPPRASSAAGSRKDRKLLQVAQSPEHSESADRSPADA